MSSKHCKIRLKQQIQNMALQMYSNETLVFFIINNCYVAIKSINVDNRLFSIYIDILEFEILDDFTIYFVNCISNLDELFFFYTQKNQTEYPLFNEILRNQQGASVLFFNLMEMKEANKLWLCYRWIGFCQIDLQPIIEKILIVSKLIKENWIRLQKINQSEYPELLAQEVSITISFIEQALK